MTPTTDPTSQPETTGVIFLYRDGNQVGNILATDVVQEGPAIWFTEMRRYEKSRGHWAVRPAGRHRYESRKGVTIRFESLVTRPDLASQFGDLYGWEYTKSECE